jgi:nucleoside-diphosphate-sugar epimerase
MSEDLHVVLGAGPVGTWTARALLRDGKRVRVVSRSGRRSDLMPAEAEVIAADVSESSGAAAATNGATTVYQALNAPYDKWPESFPPLQRSVLDATAREGARYVSVENLYVYGEPDGAMSEDTPLAANTKKGRVRAEMAQEVTAAHERGDVRVAVLRSSDYYGPGVTSSVFSARVFGPALAGKPAQIIGGADVPHSLAYIEDVGEALAILGTRDEALGQVWHAPHAPARTQREMVEMIAEKLGTPVRVRVLGPGMMRLGGLFIPEAREGVEMLYQTREPFVADSSKIQEAFGLQPTPLETGIGRTLDWYRGSSPRSPGVLARGRHPR